jgi:protoporphyrinogen IX oxidase
MLDFRLGRNTKSARFYRVFNEMPALLLVAVLLLVVRKPF